MATVRVDATVALQRLTALERTQAPYAVSLALNRIANDVQDEIRKGMQARFALKRRDFNLKGVYISKDDRANKTTWRVTIQIEERRWYLSKFEEGGDKLPVGGRRLLARPGPALKGKILQPGDPLRLKNLHIKKVGDTWRGRERTFILPLKNGQMAVMQRMESGHAGFTVQSVSKLNLNNFGTKGRGLKARKRRYGTAGYRLLYMLVARVKIKAKLEFRDTGQRVVDRQWAPRWQQAIAQAMRTAR